MAVTVQELLIVTVVPLPVLLSEHWQKQGPESQRVSLVQVSAALAGKLRQNAVVVQSTFLHSFAVPPVVKLLVEVLERSLAESSVASAEELVAETQTAQLRAEPRQVAPPSAELFPAAQMLPVEEIPHWETLAYLSEASFRGAFPYPVASPFPSRGAFPYQVGFRMVVAADTVRTEAAA